MKTSIRLLCMLAALTTFLQSLSQENSFTHQKAMELVTKNAMALSLSEIDLKNSTISDAYVDRISKAQLVYLQQTYLGLPVLNSIKTIAFRHDKVMSNAGSFFQKAALKANATAALPVVSSQVAVQNAAKHLSLEAASVIFISSVEHSAVYAPSTISKENITSTLLWVPAKDGSLKLSWQVKILPLQTPDYWLVNVDAISGEVVSKFNLTNYDNWNSPEGSQHHQQQAFDGFGIRQGTSANSISTSTYRVVPFPAESPIHTGGAPALSINPWKMAGAGNPAVTLGWHNDGTTDHDSTRGNNVWAREDRKNNDGNPSPGRAAVSTTSQPNLMFDFPLNASQPDTAPTNQNAAITQLFYWNNIMHDITYQYGFDEASGNFQNTNMGRGGAGGDYVIADAQDGGGTNNANFYTPADGANPRMQMYLWIQPVMTVNSPEAVRGVKTIVESGFSTNNKIKNKPPITADLIMYDTVDTLACSATSNNLSGKIAVISRLTCGFTVKVKNAQNAGAVAVLMINNIPGAAPFVMGGTDNTITIPAVMISKEEGEALKAVMRTGQTVNVTFKMDTLDCDLDNGVMSHEYTHGISNRLTGGPSNAACLQNPEQMGEGWSDYYGLMLTTNWQTAQTTDGPNKRGVGTYVSGQEASGFGIRLFPYSTDMTINRWTYDTLKNITNGEPHYVGEIWAATLWDMTWNIIQLDGVINPDLYNANAPGGNSVALKLVTEGLKLQPCSPGFLDGRDAILKADTLLYNGRYSCAIWKAFARRHMGVNASEGSPISYTDGVGGTELPSALIRKSVDKTQAGMNQDITYTLTAVSLCVPITNYTIVDTLPANVTYVSGGTYNAANRTVTFTVPSLTEGQTQGFTLKVTSNTGTYSPPAVLLDEPVATASIPATFTAVNTGAGAWSVSTTRSHTGTYSLYANDANTASSQTLTSANAFAVSGVSTLSFWHYFNTEPGYDGGLVELSSDNGTTWFDAGRYMVQNGYNTDVLGFTGSSGGQFIQTVINLSSFHGKSLKVRFRFTSDAGVGADGWYIDDIGLINEAGVYNNAGLFNSGGQLVSAADTLTRINDCTVPASPGFGINQWNVDVWNAGGPFINDQSWNSNYSGYFTASELNVNTTTKWNYSFGAPSDAAGYVGCPVGADNHSYSYKRQGFPCGYYSLDIPSHDDAAQLFINGAKVWEHDNCCDSHNNVWSGWLGSNDKVEFRVTEGNGESYAYLNFNLSTSVTNGDPSVFGNNQWNVYAWNSGTGSVPGDNWTTNYSGYYTTTDLNFNTQNQWNDQGAPSDATGYVGCPVAPDNHSYSAQRKGFPCGYYHLDVPNHDDAAQLFVNGVNVWEHTNGCCDSHANVWSGWLGSNDSVIFRVTEWYGGSQGALSFTAIPDTLYTWLGTVSTDWSNPSNWGCGMVPPAGANVIIPNTANQPSLTGNATIGDLKLLGQLALNGKTLTINGAVTGAGTFTGYTTSTLIIGGNAGVLHFTPGNAVLYALTIKPGATATVAGSLLITGPNSLPLPTTDNVRTALSTSMTAYDNAANNSWVSVTQAEYTNLLTTVTGSGRYGSSESYMLTTPNNGWSANYTVGGNPNPSKVPASSYIIAWSVKTGVTTSSAQNSKLKVSASQTTGYADYGGTLPNIGSIPANTRVFFVLKKPTATTPASPCYTAVYNVTAFFLGSTSGGGYGPEFYQGSDISYFNSGSYGSDAYSQVVCTGVKQW